MIKQQKLLKNLLLLFCFGVIILSCSLEDEVIQEHNHANNVKVEKVNYNELFKQKLFSNTMKRIPKKKIAVTNEFGKSVMEEQYGFTIIDTPVKVVEIDGKISYTIQIVTDNNLDGKLENLILYPDADIDKMGYIIKYNTLKNNQLSEQQVIDGGANEIKPLISSNSDENAKFTMITILTYFCTAAGTPEDCGGFDGGPCYVINNTFSGVFSPSGSSYSYNSSNSYANYVNSSNSNFGGANNSNNENSNNQLVITPINCHICPNLDIEVIVETPCEKITNGTSNADYKQKFKALSNNYGLNHETGFAQVDNNYVNGVPSSNTNVIYPEGSKNGTHVHNNDIITYVNTTISYDANIKMLSPGDFTDSLIPMQINNTDPKDTFIVMLSNEGIYAITIIEPVIWNTELAIKFQQFNKYYKKQSQYIVDKYTEMDTDSRKEYLEKMLLLGLKDIGLENKIGLFEAEIENENDSDINNYNIKWTRKKIKKVFLGYNIDSEPCF